MIVPDSAESSAAPAATVSSAPPPPAAGRWRGRVLKAVLLCGALYLAGGFWLMPWLMRLAIEHYGSAALGRSVQVAAVRFDPFAAVLTAEGIILGERGQPASDTSPPALSIARVRVDLEALTLARGQILLRALDVEQPVLRITRAADGTLNWGDLWPRPPTHDSGWSVAVHDVRVHDGRIVWQDGQGEGDAPTAIEVTGIELDLPMLERLQRGALPTERLPRLAARIGTQELVVVGEPHGEGIRFQLVAEGVNLAPWAHAAGLMTAPGVLQGRLDARLALDFATAARLDEHFTLSGTLQLHEPVWRTADARLALSAHTAALTLGDSHPLQQRWHVQTLQLAAPQLRYVAAPASNNADLPTTPAHETKTEATSPHWRIDTASLQDGQIELVFAGQRTLSLYAVQADWQQAPTEARGRVRAEAQDEHAARLRLNATLDPMLGLPIEGQATLTGLAVPRYEAWLAPLAPGGRLARGVLDAEADWRVTAAGEWSVQAGVLTLREAELRLRNRATPPLLRVQRLHADAISADAAARRVRIGSVEARAPRLALQRTAAGFDHQALWTKESAASPVRPQAAAQDADWQIETGALHMRDGEFTLDDRRARPPVRSLLRGIVLDVPNLAALRDWWQSVAGEP